MPDTTMTPVAIQQGFSDLFATEIFGAKRPEQSVAVAESTPAPEELGDTNAEDSEVMADAEEVTDEEATDEPEFSLDLKVNGEDLRITDRAEAVKLAQLGKHFTQRNEQVLQRERQVEEREAEAMRLRDQYAAYLPEIENYLANPYGERPKREGFTDELSYLKADKQWAEAQERTLAVRAERQRVEMEQAAQRDAAIARWVRDQDQAVLTAIPEWHDRDVMRRETQAMTEYALRAGMSQQALQNPLLVRDKAFVTMLRDAARYAAMQTKGVAEVQKVQTQVAAPGAARPPGESANRRRTELMNRAKSGKVADVAPAMSQLVGRVLEIQKETNNRKR